MPSFQLFPISLHFDEKKRFLGSSLEMMKGPRSLLGLNKTLTIGHDYYEALYALGGHTPINRKEYELKKKLAKRAEVNGEIKAYKGVVQGVIDLQALNDFYTWHRAFRDEKTWETLAQLNPTKMGLLKSLKEEWLSHAPYSHFSSEGLFDALEHLKTMLGFLYQQQKVAQNLWVWKKSGLIKSKLIKALDKQEKELIHHQTLLCESLYQRIELCINEGNTEKSDPLAIFLARLHALGLNTTCFQREYEPKQSPLPLLKACETIFTYGSAEQKITLQKTLILKNNNGVKTQLKLIGDKADLSLVPIEFLKYIPLQTAIFPRLFKGHQFRYEFFKLKERQNFLFQLMTSSQLEFKAPTWSLDDKDWLNLLRVGNAIEAEISRVKHSITTLKPSGESKKLLNEWNVFLENRKKANLEKKLCYLEKLSLQARPFDYANIFTYPIEAVNNRFTALHLALEEELKGFPELALRHAKIKNKLNLCLFPADTLFELKSAFEHLLNSSFVPIKLFEGLKVKLGLRNQQFLPSYQAVYTVVGPQFLVCLKKDLERLTLELALKDNRPDLTFLEQGFELLNLLAMASEVKEPFKELEGVMSEVLQAFKMFCKQQNQESIQDPYFSRFNELFKSVVYVQSSRKESQKLLQDAESYQTSISLGHSPQTPKELIHDVKNGREKLKNGIGTLLSEMSKTQQQWNNELSEAKKNRHVRRQGLNFITQHINDVNLDASSSSPTNGV